MKPRDDSGQEGRSSAARANLMCDLYQHVMLKSSLATAWNGAAWMNEEKHPKRGARLATLAGSIMIIMHASQIKAKITQGKW